MIHKSAAYALGVLGLMVAAGSAGAAEAPCTCVTSATGTVTASKGSVFLNTGAGYAAPTKTSKIAAGSQIAVGEGSSAVINFAGGCSINASANSMVTVSAADNGQYCVRSASLIAAQENEYGQIVLGGAGAGLGGALVPIGFGAAIAGATFAAGQQNDPAIYLRDANGNFVRDANGQGILLDKRGNPLPDSDGNVFRLNGTNDVVRDANGNAVLFGPGGTPVSY